MPRVKLSETEVKPNTLSAFPFGSVVTGKSNFPGRFVVIQENGSSGGPELVEYPIADADYAPSPYASPLSVQPDGLKATGEVLEPNAVVELASPYFAGGYEQLTPGFKQLVRDMLQSLNPNAEF